MPIGFESCTPRAGAPIVPLMISSLAAFLWMRGSGDSSEYQKVGPVAPGLLRGLPGAPFGHFGVVPTDQHIRHLPAAILSRARVVRIVHQQSSLVEGPGACRCWGVIHDKGAELLVFHVH